MKKVRIRSEHYSRYRIEGGELFALEGIALGLGAGSWICYTYALHWIAGLLIGVTMVAAFFWLLAFPATRLLIFLANALRAGVMVYLLVSVLFACSELTAISIGSLTALAVGGICYQRFTVFQHDMRTYWQLRRQQKEQLNKTENQ